jgi:lysophospholipase L1-like esterase
MSLGDSRTLDGTWQPILLANLLADTGMPLVGANSGQSGTGLVQWVMNLTTYLNAAGARGDVGDVIINLGVNDIKVTMPVEATWKTNFLTVLDEVHARHPYARVYLMRPWKRGYSAQADTMAGWIDDIVASRSFLHLGPDERVWMEGGDDGATMTTDGLHYSAAGYAECAAQWQTVLGY